MLLWCSVIKDSFFNNKFFQHVLKLNFFFNPASFCLQRWDQQPSVGAEDKKVWLAMQRQLQDRLIIIQVLRFSLRNSLRTIFNALMSSLSSCLACLAASSKTLSCYTGWLKSQEKSLKILVGLLLKLEALDEAMFQPCLKQCSPNFAPRLIITFVFKLLSSTAIL